MRTGEGGRIHPQGFRARPILPGGAFSVNSVSFRKPPRPASAPAPSTLSHCFQDRKLYQKWGTNRMVYHPHCTDGKAEERGAAQGHRRIRSPKLSTPAWPGHPPPPQPALQALDCMGLGREEEEPRQVLGRTAGGARASLAKPGIWPCALCGSGSS